MWLDVIRRKSRIESRNSKSVFEKLYSVMSPEWMTFKIQISHLTAYLKIEIRSMWMQTLHRYLSFNHFPLASFFSSADISKTSLSGMITKADNWANCEFSFDHDWLLTRLVRFWGFLWFLVRFAIACISDFHLENPFVTWFAQIARFFHPDSTSTHRKGPGLCEFEARRKFKTFIFLHETRGIEFHTESWRLSPRLENLRKCRHT